MDGDFLPTRTGAARELPTARRPVLEPSLIEAVCAANAAFLDELASTAGCAGALGGLLPAPVMATLVGLDGSERRRAAAVPFTLFSLRFADAPYWRSLIDAPPTLSRRALQGEGVARTAIFLAWHLVQARPATAGLAMGMSVEVSALCRALPLSQLERLGSPCSAVLAPRWPTHGPFWARLLAAARSRAAQERARFFGMQLLAGECLADAPARPVVRLSSRRPVRLS